MKRMNIWMLSALLALPASAQKITTQHEVVDCGQVVFSKPVIAEFVLKNDGRKPLVINNVLKSCGCTEVDYPKTSIAAGESFVIKAVYDAKQMGTFTKQVCLYTNADEEPFILSMRGKVVGSVVDFAGPYYYASFAILVKEDSPLANATSIMDFAGYKGSAQSATIWYSECLPQMEGALIQTAAESAPAMIMGVETGVFDFVVTDMPTATGAAIAYNDLKVLDFSGTDGDFKFSEEEREENVNIGISVRKGNTVLKEAIDSYLDTLTVDDFNTIMDEAIKVQPLGE